MSSSDYFHMDFDGKNEDFDFFDPNDFGTSSNATTKLFPWEEQSKTFNVDEFGQNFNDPLMTNGTNEKDIPEFNFDFGPLSNDTEPQVVPNEVPETQQQTEDFKTIGNYRDSQTPGPSTAGTSRAGSNAHWEPEVLIANEGQKLESLSRIPTNYRSVFDGYATFNKLQSLAFNVTFTTNKPVVISAPTSSGKTVIFELAILRLLVSGGRQKVLFMAPTKAVVNEKYRDWETKFSKFGLKCLEVTGDSEIEDYKVLEKATIIFTTPEKWDSLTRKAQEISQVVDSLRLVLIDEVHCLNDDGRGATMEVVISRMKTINQKRREGKMRFIAVSATIPNAEDIALWLGTPETPSVVCILPSDMRPVVLQNYVLGYFCADSQNDFQFEKKLSYKVADVINEYSSGKPTLIFVPTRNSTVATAQQILKSPLGQSFIRDFEQKRELIGLSYNLRERNLKELVTRGIAYHHAGLSYQDRTAVMEAFSTGRIMVLCCTTTLALGVNVPAHLVIIKSTFIYANGVCTDLPESQVLQMIGRAGRPQFDTSAVAVIMTKQKLVSKYEKMLNGTQIIESFLHKHLSEHINAEIVLKTITDVTVALEWIHSTFLYIRVGKNQKYYGIDSSFDKKAIEDKLQNWCIKELNGLKKFDMITMDEDCASVRSTDTGKVMARYCVSVESMKKFMQLTGRETIRELLELISSCEEVTKEMRLRNPEKTQLNSFNEASKNEPNKEVIKYQLKGKIKSPEMKANCLIQVMLGNIKLDDYSLYQDSKRVLKSGQRASKCLLEYLMTKDTEFAVLVNSSLLAKCFRAGIWEDSPYVTRQFSVQCKEVSVTVSRDIATAGITSLEAIESALPQILEMFAKKQTPYGTMLRNVIRKIPRYEITMTQSSNENNADENGDYFVTLIIKIVITNLENIRSDFDIKHSTLLFIGNYENDILHKQRIYDRFMVQNNGEFQAEVKCRPSQVANKVLVRLISEMFVGIDVYKDFYPEFDDKKVSKYFATANQRIKLRSHNPSVPKELKFFDKWKHLCRRDCCGHQTAKNATVGNVILEVNNEAPSVSVSGVKRKNCEIGPLDKYIDNRRPQAVDDDDEMLSDPEIDAFFANFDYKLPETGQKESDKNETAKESEAKKGNQSQSVGANTLDDLEDESIYNFEKNNFEALESATKKFVSKLKTKTSESTKRSTNSNWEEYENLYRSRTQSNNYGSYSSGSYSRKKFNRSKIDSSQKERTKTSFTFSD